MSSALRSALYKHFRIHQRQRARQVFESETRPIRHSATAWYLAMWPNTRHLSFCPSLSRSISLSLSLSPSPSLSLPLAVTLAFAFALALAQCLGGGLAPLVRSRASSGIQSDARPPHEWRQQLTRPECRRPRVQGEVLQSCQHQRWQSEQQQKCHNNKESRWKREAARDVALGEIEQHFVDDVKIACLHKWWLPGPCLIWRDSCAPSH